MRSHVQACAAGTLTVEQYCQQHGIKKSSYYYWHKRLQKQPDMNAFVPLNLSSGRVCDVVVSFPNGINISFNGNTSISVLKELACCI